MLGLQLFLLLGFAFIADAWSAAVVAARVDVAINATAATAALAYITILADVADWAPVAVVVASADVVVVVAAAAAAAAAELRHKFC